MNPCVGLVSLPELRSQDENDVCDGIDGDEAMDRSSDPMVKTYTVHWKKTKKTNNAKNTTYVYVYAALFNVL